MDDALASALRRLNRDIYRAEREIAELKHAALMAQVRVDVMKELRDEYEPLLSTEPPADDLPVAGGRGGRGGIGSSGALTYPATEDGSGGTMKPVL